MSNRLRVMLAGLILSLSSLSVQAIEGLMVHNAYARATFALAPTGAVYLTVMNHGNKKIKLIAASVDKGVASEAQIHTTIMDGDMMKMRQVTDGIDIEQHATVEFKPGGFHIMLMGLVKPLKIGESFMLTLHFTGGETARVKVEIVEQSKQGGHHHH